jgi:tRNA(fMet)-specific endonuclease VapC
MRGWLASIARARSAAQELRAYDQLLGLIEYFRDRPILPFNDSASREPLRLKAMKLRLGTMDLKIAAVVLAHGALLVSRNLRDFRRVPGLRVEDWTLPE